eukprot:EG_transcript_6064
MAAAVPDPSPGMSCVLFLEEEQLGGRVLLPGFYAKQLESHAAHHMFGVELQDDSERRWPVTLAWRVPGSVTGGLLLEDGWRRIVQRFALKAADKLLLFPPLLSPDACRLPFRVERQGAIYLPASVDEPGPSGAPPASSARADAPRASPGQLAGNGPPEYTRTVTASDLVLGMLPGTAANAFFHPLLTAEGVAPAEVPVVDQQGKVWPMQPTFGARGWHFSRGWRPFRDEMQLEAGDMLAFSLLLDPPRLKVDVQKTHKKRSRPVKVEEPSASPVAVSSTGAPAPPPGKRAKSSWTRSMQAYIANRSLPRNVKRTAEGYAPIGPWIMEDLLGQNQGDRRHLKVGQRYPEDYPQQHWVPGYIGVRTASAVDGKPSAAWTPEYTGPYDVVVWNRAKAILIPAGRRNSAEEAAEWFDEVSVSCYGVAQVNTNFCLSPEMRQRYAASALPGSSTFVLAILQLLRKEDFIPWEAATGTKEEWDEWRAALQRLVTIPRTAEVMPGLIKRLADCIMFFLTHLNEEALLPYWRGDAFQKLLQAVPTCAALGSKVDHYYAHPLECHTCLLNLKGADLGANTHHGQRTIEAVMRVVERELISMSAVDALVAGKDAAGAARRDQRELEAEEAPTLQRLKKAIRQGKLPTPGVKAEGAADAAGRPRMG